MPEIAPQQIRPGGGKRWSDKVSNETREFSRIWQAFMTARFTVGLVLLVLQITLLATGVSHSNKWLIGIALLYFISSLVSGMSAHPHFLGSTFSRPWIRLVGIDVLAFSSMQLIQGSTINYTPLFALPILLVSVLGSLQLALGTAAGVTVLLLVAALWTYIGSLADAASYLAQSALSGVGYFAMAVLANQLASRLAAEALRARHGQAAAAMQRQVNALVIESLPDGVLIVDAQGQVRTANPAANALLSSAGTQLLAVADLHKEPAWEALLQLTQQSFQTRQGQQAEVAIRFPGQGPRRVLVHTRLTDTRDTDSSTLCVLFLRDQRELEARMRTEKLASMGRMSTAVAHEIRNPLAAIAQASALLEEDLTEARQRTLIHMVAQNAARLAKIVDDILDAARVQPQAGRLTPLHMALNDAVLRICHDWCAHLPGQAPPVLDLQAEGVKVHFDSDHLHRVLVNLLDNARRYASGAAQSIQVHTRAHGPKHALLCVWSDGAPMDQSVESHLFEPFFSSESRSSGLGLYICRQLCESHGAHIAHQRSTRALDGIAVDGNEFSVDMEQALDNGTLALHERIPAPWPTATP